MPRSPSPQKALGAFYTSETVARALVAWGLRVPRSAVLDPSCGDGRFLIAAARAGAERIVGCDIDPSALREARQRLGRHGATCTLTQCDFFAIDPGTLGSFELVTGNPPFIRYQHFRGETRARALQAALRAGVRLTGLTSSWAPFTLHAMQFVSPGGDLAMVVPAEILQTQYGLPTLRAFTRHFASVSLLMSDRNLFDGVLEECALLLAESRGGTCTEVRLVSAANEAGVLARLSDAKGGVMISAGPRSRFAEGLLTVEQRQAWREVLACPGVLELGEVGTLTNGYVSGDNDFFHRTPGAARAAGIPQTWLRPAARSSKSLRGLSFTAFDLAAREAGGAAHHLVVPQEALVSRGRFSSGRTPLASWILEGQLRGTPARYKCRTREPWWLVPGLVEADVLLAYMSGGTPRAASNEVRALYTNSLHGIRLHKHLRAESVAFAMHSTLSLLSLEIEGRSYGGGMLKLEPTEMRHARLVLPSSAGVSLRRAIQRADELLRAGQYDHAVELADRVLLEGELGLSRARVALLSNARNALRARRMGRANPATQATAQRRGGAA